MSFEELKVFLSRVMVIYKFMEEHSIEEICSAIKGFSYDVNRKGFLYNGKIAFDFDQSDYNMISLIDYDFISYKVGCTTVKSDYIEEEFSTEYEFSDEVYFQLSTVFEPNKLNHIMASIFLRENCNRDFYLDTAFFNMIYYAVYKL